MKWKVDSSPLMINSGEKTRTFLRRRNSSQGQRVGLGFSSPPCGLSRYKRFTDRVFICGTRPWHFPHTSIRSALLPLPTQVLDLYGSYQEVSLSSINIYPTNSVDSGAVCTEGPSAHAVGWMNAGWSTGAADYDCSMCLPPFHLLSYVSQRRGDIISFFS